MKILVIWPKPLFIAFIKLHIKSTTQQYWSIGKVIYGKYLNNSPLIMSQLLWAPDIKEMYKQSFLYPVVKENYNDIFDAIFNKID